MCRSGAMSLVAVPIGNDGIAHVSDPDVLLLGARCVRRPVGRRVANIGLSREARQHCAVGGSTKSKTRIDGSDNLEPGNPSVVEASTHLDAIADFHACPL